MPGLGVLLSGKNQYLGFVWEASKQEGGQHSSAGLHLTGQRGENKGCRTLTEKP